MAIPVKILQLDNALVDAPIAADSLNELARKEPEGIYTVARTFQGTKAVLFSAHLDRLEESAKLEGIPVTFERNSLRIALHQLIDQSGIKESRFRITIPREHPDRIWLAAEPLPLVPAAYREKGVHATTSLVTRPNPKAKSNAWVSLREDAAKLIPPASYEGIILNEHKQLMEGFSSNFYAVKEGELYSAERGILRGIARRIVLTVAADIAPIHNEPILIDALPIIDEAFLSSSSRGIVPIVQIDDVRIGDGMPGRLTAQLSTAYDRWVQANLEPICPDLIA